MSKVEKSAKLSSWQRDFLRVLVQRGRPQARRFVGSFANQVEAALVRKGLVEYKLDAEQGMGVLFLTEAGREAVKREWGIEA